MNNLQNWPDGSNRGDSSTIVHITIILVILSAIIGFSVLAYYKF